jgi:NADH:ubiquinone oxidoreductase subunit K
MFVAGALAFVTFARFGLGALHGTAGTTMALFAGGIALAELTVGLAMATLVYREYRSFALDADRG